MFFRGGAGLENAPLKLLFQNVSTKQNDKELKLKCLTYFLHLNKCTVNRFKHFFHGSTEF